MEMAVKFQIAFVSEHHFHLDDWRKSVPEEGVSDVGVTFRESRMDWFEGTAFSGHISLNGSQIFCIEHIHHIHTGTHRYTYNLQWEIYLYGLRTERGYFKRECSIQLVKKRLKNTCLYVYLWSSCYYFNLQIDALFDFLKSKECIFSTFCMFLNFLKLKSIYEASNSSYHHQEEAGYPLYTCPLPLSATNKGENKCFCFSSQDLPSSTVHVSIGRTQE